MKRRLNLGCGPGLRRSTGTDPQGPTSLVWMLGWAAARVLPGGPPRTPPSALAWRRTGQDLSQCYPHLGPGAPQAVRCFASAWWRPFALPLTLVCGPTSGAAPASIHPWSMPCQQSVGSVRLASVARHCSSLRTSRGAHPSLVTWSSTDPLIVPWPLIPPPRRAWGGPDSALLGERGLPSLRAGHPFPQQARPGSALQARPSLRAGGLWCCPLTARRSLLCPSLRTGRWTPPPL